MGHDLLKSQEISQKVTRLGEMEERGNDYYAKSRLIYNNNYNYKIKINYT